MKEKIVKTISKAGPFIALLFVFGLFASLGGSDFRQWGTMNDILMLSVIVGIAALGATLVIISGGIDLSVGCTIAAVTVVIARMFNMRLGDSYLIEQFPILWPLCAMAGGVAFGAAVGVVIGSSVVGHIGRAAAVILGLLVMVWLRSGADWPLFVCIPLGILAGGALWFLNTISIKKTPLPPFIVTLGLWASLRGTAKWLAGGTSVYVDVSEVNGKAIWLNTIMRDIKVGDMILPMPGVWMWGLLAVAMGLMLKYTRFGRHIYAVGSNENTARLCGINVEKTKILTYLVAIACAGLAGVLRFAWLGMGDPTTDIGTELLVIASVVIGGASLNGGVGGIGGTLVGTLIIMIVYKGCTVLGLQNFVQEIVTGAIIVAAVTLDQIRHKKAD
ncbi:MAG: ABC transporter permease [Lentisphaeria bacterium]|nr:ABC transporter permease [Lentisphaeria bacterium]